MPSWLPRRSEWHGWRSSSGGAAVAVQQQGWRRGGKEEVRRRCGAQRCGRGECWPADTVANRSGQSVRRCCTTGAAGEAAGSTDRATTAKPEGMLGRVVSDLVATSRHCISASNFIASQLRASSSATAREHRAVPRSPGASSAILRRGGKGSFIRVKGVKIKGRKGYERSHGATLISWGVYALHGSGGPRCNAWSCRCQGAPVRTGHAHIMRIAYAWCAHGVHSVQE